MPASSVNVEPVSVDSFFRSRRWRRVAFDRLGDAGDRSLLLDGRLDDRAARLDASAR